MKYKVHKIETPLETFNFVPKAYMADKIGVKEAQLILFESNPDIDALDGLNLSVIIDCLQQLRQGLIANGFEDATFSIASEYESYAIEWDLSASRFETDDEVLQRLQEAKEWRENKKEVAERKKEVDAVRAKHKAEAAEKEERELYQKLHEKYGD